MTKEQATTMLSELLDKLYKQGEVRITPEASNQLNNALQVLTVEPKKDK